MLGAATGWPSYQQGDEAVDIIIYTDGSHSMRPEPRDAGSAIFWTDELQGAVENNQPNRARLTTPPQGSFPSHTVGSPFRDFFNPDSTTTEAAAATQAVLAIPSGSHARVTIKTDSQALVDAYQTWKKETSERAKARLPLRAFLLAIDQHLMPTRASRSRLSRWPGTRGFGTAAARTS